MENINDSDTSSSLRTRYNHHMIGTGIAGLGNKKTSGDHPNYRIVEVGQDT